METRYHIIKDFKELRKLIKSCKKTGYASVDFESNAEPIYNNTFKPTILSVSFQPGFGCSIPLDHFETPSYCGNKWDWKKALKVFGHNIIENPNITKVAWNFKFDGQIFEKYGIYYRGTLLDGMLMKYILDEHRPHGLKDMTRRYLPEMGDYEKADEFDKIPWDKKELIPLCKYGCQDTDYTLRLSLFLENKLISLNMYHIYRNLFSTASRVVTSMEKTGLFVDREFNQYLLETYKPKIDEAVNNCLNLKKVKRYSKILKQKKIDNYISQIQDELDELDYNDPKDAKKIKSREDKISRIRSGEFTTKKELELLEGLNLNSNPQLKELLYTSPDGFEFPILKYTKKNNRDTTEPSCDEEALTQLRLTIENPESPKAIFLDNLLVLRGLEKMYKTFILGWSEKIQDDSKLHGVINIHGTDSNRRSSKEPNVQQIPKVSVDPNIKKQLIAPHGKLYLVFDYSQSELRMMAHLSGDDTYLEAFRRGDDPHLSIAADKYHVPIEEATKIYEDENHPDHKLWKTRRKQAKQIAFGLIYGIGDSLLAQKLSDPKAGLIVSKEEAKAEMDSFFAKHPKILKFKQKQEKFIQKHGYYVQLFGTKRRLPEIWDGTKEEQAYAKRLGLNFPVQGAAANMANFGEVLIYWDMHNGKLPKMDLCSQVHDAEYMLTDPKYINIWTIFTLWDILRNPQTKKYFNFEIKDVDLSMDFSIGRSMAEELPFIPFYDYNNMLKPDFSVEEYMKEYHKYKEDNTKNGINPTYPGNFKKLYLKEMKKYKKEYENSL